MPYELRGNCVHKVGSDTALKCYDNHEDALAYLRALEANVNDAKQIEALKAFRGKLEPEDVNYIPLSTTKGEACANCRWFFAYGGCFIVDDSDPDDEPILATGYCDRWEASALEPAEDPLEVLTEAITEVISQQSDVIASTLVNAMPAPDFANTTYEAGSLKQPSLIERLKVLLGLKPKGQPSFSIFKDSAGVPHWHAIYTNNFKDREDEILTEAAHDKFIGRLDMGLVPFPTLQAWHTPGSDHGKATCIWRDAHMIHAVGDFDDTPLAKSALKYYEANAPYLKMSHMFEVPDWAFDGRHYEDYNTLEITTLPPEAAANPYTSFEEFITMSKERSPEKSRYLENLFGKDGLAQIDAASAEVNKNLEAAKIAFKDHADVIGNPTPATPLSSEAEKGLKEAYADLQTQVNELAETLNLAAKSIVAKDALIKAQTKALKDFETRYDTETAEWQKAWDVLAKQVNLPPSRATQNSNTTLKAQDLLKAQELDSQLNGDNSPESWLGGKVKNPVAVQ